MTKKRKLTPEERERCFRAAEILYPAPPERESYSRNKSRLIQVKEAAAMFMDTLAKTPCSKP